MKALLKLGIAMGLINYLTFLALAVVLGGNALHGYAASGHYYLLHAGHVARVSRIAFLASKWQSYALLMTFPTGLLCAWRLSKSQSIAA
jgi:hypothetical protein